jgi:hypothetical protein
MYQHLMPTGDIDDMIRTIVDTDFQPTLLGCGMNCFGNCLEALPPNLDVEGVDR